MIQWLGFVWIYSEPKFTVFYGRQITTNTHNNNFHSVKLILCRTSMCCTWLNGYCWLSNFAVSYDSVAKRLAVECCQLADCSCSVTSPSTEEKHVAPSTWQPADRLDVEYHLHDESRGTALSTSARQRHLTTGDDTGICHCETSFSAAVGGQTSPQTKPP